MAAPTFYCPDLNSQYCVAQHATALLLCALQQSDQSTHAGKPMAMAQSCLGFGAFSFVFDYMGNKSPPAAAALTSSQPCPYPGRSCGRQWQVYHHSYPKMLC